MYGTPVLGYWALSGLDVGVGCSEYLTIGFFNRVSYTWLKEMRVVHELLERAVELIVAAANPVKIILFGSAARGDMGKHSDLDMLVVIRPGQHRRQTAQKIYRNLIGLGFAVDLVVVTTADLKEFKDDPGVIIATALKEGLELYAA